MPTHIDPPAPPIEQAFDPRVMDYDQLVRFLCRHFGYNRKSLVVEEYIAEHPATVTWIRSFIPTPSHHAQ